MTIHGLTVCVDFGDLLARSIDVWMTGLASLTVVTAPRDERTQMLAIALGANLVTTDVFTAGDAVFNKGAAMEEARQRVPWNDWCVFFDADMLPPRGWIDQVRDARPEPGRLHGASRVQWSDGLPMVAALLPPVEHDLHLSPGIGFFQLFHTGDERVRRSIDAGAPLIETHWRNAGGYDMAFQRRWSKDLRVRLPLTLIHLAKPGQWNGRGRGSLLPPVTDSGKLK